MVTITPALRRPFKTPFEPIFTSMDSSDVVRLRFEKSLGMKRMAMSALYGTNKLQSWNQLNGDSYGNPWLGYGTNASTQENDGSVGQLVLNTGPSAFFASADWSSTDCDHLPGGAKIASNNNFTLDVANNKYTEEFYVDNDLEETTPTVLYDDDDALWSAVGLGTTEADDAVTFIKGTHSIKIDVDDGVVNSGGLYTLAGDADYSAKEFLCFYLYGANSGDAITVSLLDNIVTNGKHTHLVDNFVGWKRFVIPLLSMTANGTGSVAAARKFYVLFDDPSADRTLYIDRVLVDVGQDVDVEAYVPDTLAAAQSVKLYSWTGAAYEQFAAWDAEDDTTGETIDGTKLEFMDGTLITNIYGALTSALSVFRKGIRSAAATVVYGTGALTYSANYGCKSRVGFQIRMPPNNLQDAADAGISQTKLKLEVYYSMADSNTLEYGGVTYEFADSLDNYYGLQNLNDSWLALFPSAGAGSIEYFIFDRRPTYLAVRADENEIIDRIDVTLPKGGTIFAGTTYHGNVATDTNSDGVPDFLEAIIDPSLKMDLRCDEGTGTAIHDISGNAHPGTLTGGAWAMNGADPYLTFNGTAGDKITVTDHVDLRLGSALTVVCWFKSSGVLANACLFFRGSAMSPNNSNYAAYLADNQHLYGFVARSTAGENVAIGSDVHFNDNVWHHVVVAADVATLIMYVDGVVQGVPVATGWAFNTAAGNFLAMAKWSGDGEMTGSVDDIRIYNRKLSATEVKQLYDGTIDKHRIPSLNSKFGYARWP